MATVTSVGTGLWSAAGTWDSGVPADGDDVVISAGHTVTFDADQSAFTTGVKITITGTLNHALTGGPYTMFLKTGASLVGAGTWNVGTEVSPIPFAVKHTITGAAGWYVDGLAGLTMTVYGAEPSIKYVKLSGTGAIGQTELSVDTDVTGDIWADGDKITVSDVNGTKEVEEYTIATGGIASGAITLTGAGLTVAKSTGAYVTLVSRNVKFISVGTADYTLYKLTNAVLAGGMFYGISSKNYLSTCTNLTISGGCFSVMNYAVITGINNTVNGGVFTNLSGVAYTGGPSTINGGTAIGCTTIFSATSNVWINDFTCLCSNSLSSNVYGLAIIDGVYSYNNIVFLSNAICFGGTYTNNVGIMNFSYGVFNNCTFSDNTRDFYRAQFTCTNTQFSTVEALDYLAASLLFYSESIDHDQVAGAYKVWTAGGVTTKQAVTYPTGFTNSMQTVLESATSEGYWQKEISVGAGQSVNITSYLRKDSSMTYLPRVIMFLKNTTDPFAGGTGLHTFTMTDSVDTWEDDTYTYSNDTSEDVVLVIRTQGKNATGNLFSYLDIEVINVDLTSVIALLNTIDGKADTIDANVDAVLADTGTDGVVVASLATDSITAAALKADAVTKIQNGLATTTALSTVSGLVDDLESRLTAARAGYLDNLNTGVALTAAGVDAILDEAVVGSYTMRQLLKVMAAALAGKATGGGTTSVTFRGVDDTSDVIVATVDANGNRSAVTLTV